MRKLINKLLVGYALVAAMLYSVAAGIFIHYQSYVQSWILYIGNVVFGVTIALFLFRYYKESQYRAKISQLVLAGQVTIVVGIFISCILCLLLLLVMSPGFFMQAATGNNVLKSPPGQLQHGKNGYLLVLLMDTVIGNIGTGAFISVLFPFTIARSEKDQ